MGLPTFAPRSWGYRGTITHRPHEEGLVKLPLKDKEKEPVTLSDLLNEHVPELKDGARFYLHPYLYNGILQTMYLYGADFSQQYKPFYGREIVSYSDGGVSTADWAMREWDDLYAAPEGYNKEKFDADAAKTHPENWPRLQPNTRFLDEEELAKIPKDTRPLIVVAHGLAGGSHENIIRALVTELLSVGNGQFNVVVLNSRGCARSKIANKKLFSAFHTMDIREFINREHARQPERKIYGLGFSFGSVIFGNYLGEEGDKSPLSGAVCCAGPWDMFASSKMLNDDFWISRLFGKNLVKHLSRLLHVNRKELEYDGSKGDDVEDASPTNPASHIFTKENLARASTMACTRDFDNFFTAPALGFKNANDYYKAASPVNIVGKIRVPTLLINALDDPMVGAEGFLPIEKLRSNKHILLCTTDIGGHLAYLDKNYTPWMAGRVAEFLSKMDTLVA
ncbi:ABR194Cp [Eremothecium gossypii ATCC 10895]|uniref:alcohol O-acetyltransferase n=1 Tax=Eremothecium gossypii (strain ATCC 10895 / CBS 109.51 / FGSC 9923 / NRRL Y-1056) TaxID=284811 RepID=Q75D28_EREGS|nr:ABR194Cp [Eremothecium gossypii ATCC 10895]AAS50967.1 ABR194Cp [Eremothecium gossypii ATCC 10895]AEY95256.1 FABR194Cp [Eremothecium gossypii FDAG1]